jgi:putative endonuclease
MMRFWRRSTTPLDRIALGRIGEDTAVRLLGSRGYRIVERNWRVRGGEIDIIAQHGKEVVFVEVKSRTGDMYGPPSEAVDTVKQRKLVDLAQQYVAHRLRREVPWRFDIVEVWLTLEGKVTRTNLIQAAFRPQHR